MRKKLTDIEYLQKELNKLVMKNIKKAVKEEIKRIAIHGTGTKKRPKLCIVTTIEN